MCQDCERERPTSLFYTSDHPIAGRYSGQQWCQECILEAQLSHARKVAAKIPELEAELKAERAKYE